MKTFFMSSGWGWGGMGGPLAYARGWGGMGGPLAYARGWGGMGGPLAYARGWIEINEVVTTC
jgi:hypothetical protein